MRRGFDERQDRQVADEHLANFAPCTFCGRSDERENISKYGARCGECYASYCRGTSGNAAPKSLAERIAVLQKLRGVLAGTFSDPKAWARKLQAREHGGERLTLVQRQAWREALPEVAEVAA